ncbi:MAG: response regulator transcription factor [Bacteroidota bacterium]
MRTSPAPMDAEEKTLRLWIVEDNRRYIASFQTMVEHAQGFELEAVFEDFETLREQLAGAPGDLPDVLVMDIGLPGINGLKGIRILRGSYPTLPIVVLTLQDTAAKLFEALRAGASGYVIKDTASPEMFGAFRQAHQGGMYFDANVAHLVREYLTVPRNLEDELSHREREVLEQLVVGQSKARIADALHLSPYTIDTHMRNIYRKLQAQNAAEAAAKATRMGIAWRRTTDAIRKIAGR